MHFTDRHYNTENASRATRHNPPQKRFCHSCNRRITKRCWAAAKSVWSQLPTARAVKSVIRRHMPTSRTTISMSRKDAMLTATLLARYHTGIHSELMSNTFMLRGIFHVPFDVHVYSASSKSTSARPPRQLRLSRHAVYIDTSHSHRRRWPLRKQRMYMTKRDIGEHRRFFRHLGVMQQPIYGTHEIFKITRAVLHIVMVCMWMEHQQNVQLALSKKSFCDR